jgi:membrane protein
VLAAEGTAMISPSVDRTVQVLRAIVHETRAENVTFMAGSIAYHAFISLLPFLLVILLAISAVGDPELGQRFVRLASAYLTPNSTELLVGVLENATQSRSVTVVGLLALGLIGGSTPSVVQSGFVVVAFFPLYYVFPDEDVSVREVIPGTIFAAVGWTALEGVFQFYVAVASKSETYGIIGAILLLLTWLYFSGLVVLLGAVINAVLAGRSEDTADLGWGDAAPTFEIGGDNERELDPFVVPLRTLGDALDDETPITIRAGETEIQLPPPSQQELRIATIDRPRFLGGYREHADLRLRWEADTAHPDRLRQEAADAEADAGSVDDSDDDHATGRGD